MVTIRMQRSVDTTLHDDILLIDRDQNNALERIWKKIGILEVLLVGLKLIKNKLSRKLYSTALKCGFTTCDYPAMSLDFDGISSVVQYNFTKLFCWGVC